VTKILTDDCTEIQMSIEAFRTKNAGSGAHAGPSSPSKFSRIANDDNSLAQRLKRKASATFTLPQPTPEKKLKTTTSPLKLNRVPVPTAKPVTRAASTSQSPTKRPIGGAIITTPRTPVKKHIEELPRPARTSPRLSNPPDESPAKAALEKMSRLVLTERKTSTPKKVAMKLPSPLKSLAKTPSHKKSAVAGPSTPSPTKKRSAKQKSPSPESGDDEEEVAPVASTPSRHRRPPYLDRQFYTYRDAREVRESELCEKHFDELVRKFGFPVLRSG